MTETPEVGTIVAAENATTEADNKPLSDKPLGFEVCEFEDGDYKGFKYNVPSHNITGRKSPLDVDEGMRTAIERYGEATVLSMFDAQVLSRIRTKVKNGLEKNLKPAELVAEHTKLLTKHPDGILFSEQDALNWKPEIRDLSPNQLFKKAKEAFNNASTEPDPIKRASLLAEGQKLLLQMGAAMQG
jgi:hypothetical protein